MAIREEEVEQLVERRPDAIVVPTGNGMAVDLGDHAGAVARVRRHVLRRLLIADVVGLATAAIVSPLLVSALSSNPDDRRRPARPDHDPEPGDDPPVHRRLRRVQPLPGLDPPDLAERLQRPPQHRPRPAGERVPVRHRGLRRPPDVRLPGRERGQDPGHVRGGRRRRPAGPRGLVRAHGTGPGRARCRSSWSGPASWPRRWRATSGPTRASTSSASSTTARWAGATCSASSRTCPSCAAATTWPGWSSASRGPTPSAPRRC